jgi:threonine synthase
MLYKSTRGGERGKTFESVLVSPAYALDGGLYVPEAIPLLSSAQLVAWSRFTFQDVCAEVMSLFTGLNVKILRGMTATAFRNFNDEGVPLPMSKFGDLIILDASQGPTLAFKDVGQQVVAQLLNYYLGRQKRKAKIVVDTSGDTGI